MTMTLPLPMKRPYRFLTQLFMTRIKEARPILVQIKALLDDAKLKVPPKSPLGAALFYALTHWEALNTYL